MIKINLLPPVKKGHQISKAPFMVLVTVIIAGLICFAVFMFQQARTTLVKHDITNYQKEKDLLKPKVEAVQAKIEELEQKERAINELAGQERLLWSKKINAMSDLIPENVKVTHIYIENKEGKRIFRMEGVSYSKNGEERIALIAKFMDALKNNKTFYLKPSGQPNFGEVQFVQTVNSINKDSGWLVSNFEINMEML